MPVEKRDMQMCRRVFHEEGGVLFRCRYAMQRQPAAPSFKLVGSGFHSNDYPKR